MEYIGKDGKVISFKQLIPNGKRTLTFVHKCEHSHIPEEQKECWGHVPIAQIVFEVAGHLCTKMKYRSFFVNPQTNRMSYSYDIYFLQGVNVNTKKKINEIMANIEERVANELYVEIPSTHNHNKGL